MKRSCMINDNNLQVDGETSGPQLLAEADLITLMEAHGIGTDATHADHIETIKTRKYVGLTPDNRFIPGQLGMGLVDGSVPLSLMSFWCEIHAKIG